MIKIYKTLVNNDKNNKLEESLKYYYYYYLKYESIPFFQTISLDSRNMSFDEYSKYDNAYDIMIKSFTDIKNSEVFDWKKKLNIDNNIFNRLGSNESLKPISKNSIHHKLQKKIRYDSLFEKSKSRYYIKKFNLSGNKIEDKENICRNYLNGMMWIFYTYFDKYNYGNSIWIYKYTDSPLLKDIYDYFIKSNYDLNIFKKTYYSTNNKIILYKYFNSIHRILYISDIDTIIKLVPKYKELFYSIKEKTQEKYLKKLLKNIDDNEDFFNTLVDIFSNKNYPNINWEVNKIYNNNHNNRISCNYDSRYLSKCKLYVVSKIHRSLRNKNYDFKFISAINKLNKLLGINVDENIFPILN